MSTPGKKDAEKLHEEAAERVRALNEQIIEAGRKAGTQYLDAYEQTLKGIADYEQKLADASPVEAFSTLLNAQADFVREISKAVTAQGRELLQ
jgi:hypothetical protein